LDKIKNPENYGLSPWKEEKFNNDILPIINHASQDYNNDSWRSFVNETIEADKYRKENFQETFPELYKIVEFAWDKLYR
jgi:hypothetical protein